MPETVVLRSKPYFRVLVFFKPQQFVQLVDLLHVGIELELAVLLKPERVLHVVAERVIGVLRKRVLGKLDVVCFLGVLGELIQLTGVFQLVVDVLPVKPERKLNVVNVAELAVLLQPEPVQRLKPERVL